MVRKGLYQLFGGEKDSTVLLDLVRNVCGFTDVPAVFVDTGLEYPEIREFVRTFDNVEWIRPELTFKQVIEKHGYPFPSKEVSAKVRNARRYIENLRSGEYGDNIPCYTHMADFLNVDKRQGSEELKLLQEGKLIDGEPTYEKLCDIANKEREKHSFYNKKKWLPLLFAPFPISDKCCQVMKKNPTKAYECKTGRKPILGQLAEESIKRRQGWEKTGCNAFYADRPQSNPMAFWTEQDVLMYIKTRNIKICSVYGDVVEDISNTDEVEGQMTFSDLEGFGNCKGFDADRPKLKTTGCVRTGCMFCGYGCHLNKDQRFVTMKDTHPKQYEYIMKPTENGGLGYKEVIDWLNENVDTNIEY